MQVYPGAKAPREYRPPESVFAADSLASLASIPVTFGHPKDGVAPHNARALSIGHVTDGTPEAHVKLDGSPHEWLKTTVVITDGHAQDEIAALAAAEVSCGYSCELDFTPGVDPATGEAYDAVQKNIVYNHLALLPRGDKARAGADARIRLDNKDPMKVIKIDGKEYEFGSDAHIAKLESDHKAAMEAANARADKAEAERDTAVERADAAEKQLTDDAIDTRVLARFELLQRAAKLLPAGYNTAGKTDAQIRSDAVAAKLGATKIQGKNAAYIEARFDSLTDGEQPAQYHNPAAAPAPAPRADAASHRPLFTGPGLPFSHLANEQQRVDAQRAVLRNDEDFRAKLAKKLAGGNDAGEE